MFNVGDRIELVRMPDDPHPIPTGTKGTVTDVRNVTGLGFMQIDVDWDNGRKLMLSIPPDEVQNI